MQLKNIVVLALATFVFGDVFDSIGSELDTAFASATGSGAVFFSSLASEASVAEASLSSAFTAFTATASGAAASSYAASLKSDASAILSSLSSRVSIAAAGATNVGLVTVTTMNAAGQTITSTGVSTAGAAHRTGAIGAAALFGGAAALVANVRFRAWGRCSCDNVVRIWTSKLLGQVNRGRTS